MDPIRQFRTEQAERIEKQISDEAFSELSNTWVEAAMSRQYVYNFDWLGRPIIQFPQDIQAMQEIVWATRPDVIVETGIAHGGSLILSASLLAMLDYCDAIEAGAVLDPKAVGRKVIGVDIDIRMHNRKALEDHPLFSKLNLIEGSSVEASTVSAVKNAVGDGKRVMVCLDSMHTHDHVLAELDAYAPMTTPGCYCAVFDTFVEDMPKGFFSDRPWDVGNNPKTAVHEWVAKNPAFEIDRSMAGKLAVTAAPDGFLLRQE
jgi:cephalosporin hydroxylase